MKKFNSTLASCFKYASKTVQKRSSLQGLRAFSHSKEHSLNLNLQRYCQTSRVHSLKYFRNLCSVQVVISHYLITVSMQTLPNLKQQQRYKKSDSINRNLPELLRARLRYRLVHKAARRPFNSITLIKPILQAK